MSKIKIGNRDAGRGQSPGHSDTQASSEKELFEAIRDELDAVKLGTTIAQADATVASGSYVQAQIQTIVDLANALKVALNAIAALVDKFDKK